MFVLLLSYDDDLHHFLEFLKFQRTIINFYNILNSSWWKSLINSKIPLNIFFLRIVHLLFYFTLFIYSKKDHKVSAFYVWKKILFRSPGIKLVKSILLDLSFLSFHPIDETLMSKGAFSWLQTNRIDFFSLIINKQSRDVFSITHVC